MHRMILLLVSVIIITSCGRTPDPVGYTYSKQQVMKASHHWNILAEDTANEINNQLILRDYIDKVVYVRQTCGDENTPCPPQKETVFNETFRDLLISNLVNLGVPTSSSPEENVIVINYKAQTVFHRRDWYESIEPGFFTILASGVLVLKNAPWELITIATAGALDFTHTFYGDRSNFEVIITTSMTDKGQYLYRNSNIYYIDDGDAWHYQVPAEPADISITSSLSPAISEKKQEDKKDITELPRPILIPPDQETNLDI